MQKHPTPLVSFVGLSNSGKTTFVEKLIPFLKMKGFRIAVIKHHHNDFEIDIPGKDTYRHKKAGASTVILASPHKVAVIKDTGQELTLQEIIDRFIDNIDLVITEGYKKELAPKIEIFRHGRGVAPLSAEDKTILAIITDKKYDTSIPLFLMDDVEGVAEFVMSRFLSHRI